MEPFGGHSEDTRVAMEPISVEVAEAKHRDTLEPGVVVYFREAGGEQLGIALHLTLAEALRDELDRMIASAREQDRDQ